MLGKTFRPQTSSQPAHSERTVIGSARTADDIANRNAQSVGKRRIEARALGRVLHYIRIDVPIFRLVKNSGLVEA